MHEIMFIFNLYLIFFCVLQVRIELAKNLFAVCLALGKPKLCRVPADLALGKADAALGEKCGCRT